jgi:hypothetical protein
VPLGHPFAAPGRAGHARGRMMGFADVEGDGRSGSIRRGDHAGHITAMGAVMGLGS